MQHIIKINNETVGSLQSLLITKYNLQCMTMMTNLSFGATALVFKKEVYNNLTSFEIWSNQNDVDVYCFSKCKITNITGIPYEQEYNVIVPRVQISCDKIYTERYLKLKAFW